MEVFMNQKLALSRIIVEQHELKDLLRRQKSDGVVERTASLDQGDVADISVPLTSEEETNAVAESLTLRLEALRRAHLRIMAGTYGLSTLSGRVISDERLAADPAAELTIDEAENER
jgi:DnaK suppressor protein